MELNYQVVSMWPKFKTRVQHFSHIILNIYIWNSESLEGKFSGWVQIEDKKQFMGYIYIYIYVYK